MITVISGTNRRGSESRQFANYYTEQLRIHSDEEVRLLGLEDIPHDWFSPDMYVASSLPPTLIELQETFILPARKFAFVIAEYNGGLPGSLKLFIDAVSVRKYRENFAGKKAALIGVASGRAGNLRGMDHLTAVLNHLGAIVMPDKLPISRIEQLMDNDGVITDQATQQLLQSHAQAFVDF